MRPPIRTLAGLVAGLLLVAGASAQLARGAGPATPFLPLAGEPAPRLFVEPPIPDRLAHGAVLIPYRTENFRILPVFGPGALDVSPRAGHLHVSVDDLPWRWADAGDNRTVVVVGLPPGPHKVLVELADPTHRVLAGRAVSFTVPAAASTPQSGAQAQQPGVTRTNLQRRDLSAPGREVIQARVDFPPGTAFPRHSHPGEEIVYALEGTMEYRLDGRPPVTIRAGEVLFIPAGTIHAVANVGPGPASELATYVVEKGKPLIVSGP